MPFNGFPKKRFNLFKQDHCLTTPKSGLMPTEKSMNKSLFVTPNKAYVEEMGEHLQILVPTINAIPKTNKSLFRIYRDARFHLADPIKTRIGVIFWQGSGHRMQSSSFYMHYDPQEIFVATGIRNFKPTLLATYREYIQNEERRTELHNILEALKVKGYKIPEAKYKRMPRDCDSKDSNSYLYLMGAMYAYTTFPPDDAFHSEAIIDRNFKVYEDMFDYSNGSMNSPCIVTPRQMCIAKSI